MIKFGSFLLVLVTSAGPSVADAICKLELLERVGPHLTATLTKTAETAAIVYDPQAGFFYPATYDCDPPGIRTCVNDKSWSLDAISFEYSPYAVTLSVLDREAHGNAKTNINIRLWVVFDCIGDLAFK